MKYTLYTLTDEHTLTAQEVIAPEHDGFLLGTAHLEELSRHASQYAGRIRSVVRGLWLGVFDIYQAFFAFDLAITRSLTDAWHRGAAECGIKPEDMTPEEKIELERIIANERGFVFGVLLTVEAATKEKGGKLVAFAVIIQRWALRYDDVVNRARIMACSNQKFLWGFNALGHTKDPCNTCKVKLKDKVKRASYWHDKQVMPQNPPNSMLKCGGWG